MDFYAIIYDLRQPDRKYNELYDAIKTLAGDGNWQHPMESFWVVAFSEWANRKANSIYDKLREFIDDDDSIMVCKMDVTDYQGWMPKSLWDWFKEQKSKR